MLNAARPDLRNRCLEPAGSDSSRIPISLYFITSHPRAHSRRRRYSGGIIAVSTGWSGTHPDPARAIPWQIKLLPSDFYLLPKDFYFLTTNCREV